MNHPSSEYRRVASYTAIIGLFFAACATPPPGIEAPKVSIANIAPKDFALFEQRFDVQLRIQNPNEKELGLNGMRFDIDLNEKEFANGMTGETVVVPRFGSQVVNVEVITGIGSFLRQAQELNKTGAGGKVTYRIKGTAFVESPGTFKLPFDEKGEIDLGFTHAPEAPGAQEPVP
ncbi:MAG TPA: LEA type 2 family protein [Nitrospiraceae bacterium]|nr:LEA type 2 family protein [Nitrospiraceae bacterium]